MRAISDSRMSPIRWHRCMATWRAGDSAPHPQRGRGMWCRFAMFTLKAGYNLSLSNSIQGHPMAEITTDSGLAYEDISEGTGAAAGAGQTVSVHYTGWLTDGAKFDSSKDRNQPFRFPLGAGHVIKGWDEGVQGMKVGGVRKLSIPPQLGYGARGAGGVIPPNATLVFEVELLDIL